jgi:hypothetical protein
MPQYPTLKCGATIALSYGINILCPPFRKLFSIARSVKGAEMPCSLRMQATGCVSCGVPRESSAVKGVTVAEVHSSRTDTVRNRTKTVSLYDGSTMRDECWWL